MGCSIGTEERIAYITRRRETCLFSVGWAEELSMELIADRRAPHRAMPFSMLPTSRPSLSKKRNPNACSIPRPASFVALPPSPMTKRRHPRSRASRISSPVPKVVVSSDSFVGRNQRQSADGGHLYECGIAVSGDAVTGIARLHQRVVGTDGDTFSVTGCKQDVEHAFSTVGHGEHDGPAFGTCGTYPLGGSFSGFCRGEAAFKGIKGNYYLFINTFL